MGEGGARGGFGEPFAAFVELEGGVEGDFAEDEDTPPTGLEGRHQIEGSIEEIAAIGDFIGGGFIVGWGTVGDAGDGAVDELEAVGEMGGGGLIAEAFGVHGGEEEIAGTVASEEAAGAVGAVRSGGEAEDEEMGVRRAEVGDGAGPVGFVAVGGAADLADGLAVLEEARAAGAGLDFWLRRFHWGRGGSALVIMRAHLP